MLSPGKFRAIRETFEPMLRSMRGGAAAIAPGVAANVPIGQQLIETFIITLVFSVAMQLLESGFQQLKRYQKMAVDMFPLTYDSPQTWPQDPDSGYEILEPSKDERNGTEFSYSCFISVQPNNFTGPKGSFKHVFHKGSKGVFPLMAPGVFFKSDNNTLRVYMNSSLSWSNFVDVPNIPLKKWFHLVVMMKGRALDVYVNGNLANRFKFNDIPKLNYGGFYVMLPKIINSKTTKDSCEKIEMQTAQRKAAAEAAAEAAKLAMESSVIESGQGGALIGAVVGGVAGAVKGTELGGAGSYAGNTLGVLGGLGGSAVGAIAGGAAGIEANLMNKYNAQVALAKANFSTGQILSSNTTVVTEKDVELGINPISINGRMDGYISRIKYFAFALSYAQIDKLVKEGPNKTMFRPSNTPPVADNAAIAVGIDVTNFSGPTYVPNSAAFDANLPGYQTDAWWTSGNQPHGAMETHQTGWGPQ